MGQAFYRKYRSKTLDDVVGQEHVTKTLKNALKSGKISHAYLFTGPRGVGKTSVARILAHEVNGLPYVDENAHLDIIEIDAASNRRIDEIRDLRDKVHTMPTSAKYKVYIIDEVHMLTKEAFNALLKTLEEPPAHVIFILATTEAHKLPETIVSRTQRFSFKPIETKSSVAHLKQIAKKENISINDEALELISQHGGGSFRDSISLLEQLGTLHKKQIGLKDVEALLGLAPVKFVDSLLQTVFSGDAKQAMDIISDAETRGFHAASLAKQLSNHLRTHILEGSVDLPHGQILKLMKNLLEVPASNDPTRTLELILLEPILSRTNPKVKTKPVLEEKRGEASEAQSSTELKDSGAVKPKAEKRHTKPSSSDFSLDLWPEVLNIVKKHQNTLYSILRMAKPQFDPSANTLNLTFSFPFHQKRLDEAKSRQILLDAIQELSGQEITIEAIVEKQSKNREPNESPRQPTPAVHKNVDSVSSVFGGAEILED